MSNRERQLQVILEMMRFWGIGLTAESTLLCQRIRQASSREMYDAIKSLQFVLLLFSEVAQCVPADPLSAARDRVQYEINLVRNARHRFLKSMRKRRAEALLFCFDLNRWLVMAKDLLVMAKDLIVAARQDWHRQGEVLFEHLLTIDPQAGDGAAFTVSVTEAAEAVQLAKGQISRLCDRGTIESFGTGRDRRIVLESLAEYVIGPLRQRRLDARQRGNGRMDA